MASILRRLAGWRQHRKDEALLRESRKAHREIESLESDLAPNEYGRARRHSIGNNTFGQPAPLDYLVRFYFYDFDIDHKYTRLMILKGQPVSVAVAPCGHLYTTHYSENKDLRHDPRYLYGSGPDYTSPCGGRSGFVTAHSAVRLGGGYNEASAMQGARYMQMPAKDYARAIWAVSRQGRTPHITDLAPDVLEMN